MKLVGVERKHVGFRFHFAVLKRVSRWQQNGCDAMMSLATPHMGTFLNAPRNGFQDECAAVFSALVLVPNLTRS